MKKPLSILAILTCCISSIFADSTEPSQTPQVSTLERPITMYQKQQPAKGFRCPAKPIYGYYDGENLSIDMTNFVENNDLTIYIHCEDITHKLSCSPTEISQGIQILLDSTFWIEISTSSGITYYEITDNE